MRAREFLSELGPVAATTATSGITGKNAEIGQLTSLVTNLQKQIQDLQKNALQTDTQVKTLQKPAAPTPMGQAPQQGQQPSPVGTATKPMTAATSSTALPSITPGVNQNPQVTTMKIKQQLATNQGQSV